MLGIRRLVHGNPMQVRRQDLAAGGPTFLKYCAGYMQQQGGET